MLNLPLMKHFKCYDMNSDSLIEGNSMKNSDVNLNEFISDLTEPARSIVVVTILSQKIRNHILTLEKKVCNLYRKPTNIETCAFQEKRPTENN